MRAVFETGGREDEIQPELDKDEILRMNQTHNKYSRRQIEKFLDGHCTEGRLVTGPEMIQDKKSYEKLILACDYAMRRGSRYHVRNLEEQIDNGKYRYPKLEFERMT